MRRLYHSRRRSPNETISIVLKLERGRICAYSDLLIRHGANPMLDDALFNEAGEAHIDIIFKMTRASAMFGLFSTR